MNMNKTKNHERAPQPERKFSKLKDIGKIILSKETRQEARDFKKAVIQARNLETRKQAISAHKEAGQQIREQDLESNIGMYEFKAWDEPKAMKNLALITLNALNGCSTDFEAAIDASPMIVRDADAGEEFWGEGMVLSAGSSDRKPLGRLYNPQAPESDYQVRLLITSGTTSITSTAYLMVTRSSEPMNFEQMAQEVALEQRSSDRRQGFMNSVAEG